VSREAGVTVVTHAIRITDAARPCRKTRCQKLTRYRATYIYPHGEGSVLVPYCREHLARFADRHELPMPKEAA
jgi:hypothetical protein